MRGVRFRGLNARSLKDILAAGDDSAAFEFMDNAAPFALMGGGRVHGRGLRDRALDPDRRSGTASARGRAAETAAWSRRRRLTRNRSPCCACWAGTFSARS